MYTCVHVCAGEDSFSQVPQIHVPAYDNWTQSQSYPRVSWSFPANSCRTRQWWAWEHSRPCLSGEPRRFHPCSSASPGGWFALQPARGAEDEPGVLRLPQHGHLQVCHRSTNGRQRPKTCCAPLHLHQQERSPRQPQTRASVTTYIINTA